MARFLLDTCAIIWTGSGNGLSADAEGAINAAHENGDKVSASPFSAWELGQLVARNRLPLPLPPDVWFNTYLDRSGVILADLSVDIFVASSFLPDTPPNDPADRIIIATARTHGMTIVTRDKKILDYAQKGHVMAIAC